MTQNNDCQFDSNLSTGSQLVDDDLRALFQRTAPSAGPLDVDHLLAAAAMRRFGRRPAGKLQSVVMLAAAVVVVSIAVGGGWLAGRHAGLGQSARIQRELADNVSEAQTQIRADIARLLPATEQLLVEAQQEELKRIAVLLRDDYRARIAQVELDMHQLAQAVGHMHSIPISQAHYQPDTGAWALPMED